MTLDPRVQLVNSFPPPTAVWRYGRHVLEAAGKNASLATVCIGRLDFRQVDRRVSDLYGDWPLPDFVRSGLNVGLPTLVLQSLTRSCRSTLAQGGILHYLAEDIRPWVRGDRVAVSIHGNPLATLESREFYTFGSGYRLLVRHNLRAFGRTAIAIVQSNYVRKGLEEYGYDGKVIKIPPAVDPQFSPTADRAAARARFGLPTDRTILLSVSSAEKRKNLNILPKVMDLLPADHLLVRIGPPVRGAVTFRGLTDIEVAQLYGAADALLFPTLEEGFGLPVIEAFASGLPVVASDIPVVREVAGGAAVLADPRDPAALAAGCRLALHDRITLATGGLQRVQEFSLEKLRARLQEFYLNMEGQPRAERRPPRGGLPGHSPRHERGAGELGRTEGAQP
jgi:glycosyltransferase involved in cell wall biosynthesis